MQNYYFASALYFLRSISYPLAVFKVYKEWFNIVA